MKRLGDQKHNLVFAPTVKQARNIACALEGEKTESANELIDYYKKTVRENYTLCKTLKRGVAYNHGKLPMHVRRTLEKAISTKVVRNVVSTTTLLQGVNMPAQNIFIRNPHLYVNKTSYAVELTNYEMANLRGRAGRLLKDFIGRTFVLDENSFGETEGYDQENLFDNPRKELPTGFEEQYASYSGSINFALENDVAVNDNMSGYGYLVSYIRQIVLRHKEGAIEKLDDVGIHITREQVAAIIRKMKTLSIPHEICIKNRYWDPVILNNIYCNFTLELPISANEVGAKSKLGDVLKFLRDDMQTLYMYNRYIPNELRRGKMRHLMCEMAIKWARGIKLYDLLQGKYYEGDKGEENIEDTINMLEQVISYKLPLLLKPIYDMRLPDSSFLLALQVGAQTPIVCRMIEMGIPRETAIYLCEKIFANKKSDGKDAGATYIRKCIKKNYPKLPYWVQVQLTYLI